MSGMEELKVCSYEILSVCNSGIKSLPTLCLSVTDIFICVKSYVLSLAERKKTVIFIKLFLIYVVLI